MINIKILLSIIIGITTLTFLICALLYLKYGMFKSIYHDKLKWHKPRNENTTEFDGCNFHNTCKYCGKEIIQDSQGNWFEI